MIASAITRTSTGQVVLPKGLLKVSEVAKRLQMSESAIRVYIRTGRLKSYRAAGERVYRIPEEEVDTLLEPAI